MKKAVTLEKFFIDKKSEIKKKNEALASTPLSYSFFLIFTFCFICYAGSYRWIKVTFIQP